MENHPEVPQSSTQAVLREETERVNETMERCTSDMASVSELPNISEEIHADTGKKEPGVALNYEPSSNLHYPPLERMGSKESYDIYGKKMLHASSKGEKPALKAIHRSMADDLDMEEAQTLYGTLLAHGRRVISGMKYLNAETTDIDDPLVNYVRLGKSSLNISEKYSENDLISDSISNTFSGVEPIVMGDVSGHTTYTPKYDSDSRLGKARGVRHGGKQSSERLTPVHSSGRCTKRPKAISSHRTTPKSLTPDYINTVVISPEVVTDSGVSSQTASPSLLKKNDLPYAMQPCNPANLDFCSEKVDPIIEAIPTTLEELYLGVRKDVDVDIAFNCTTCCGSGFQPTETICAVCEGNGSLSYQQFLEGNSFKTTLPCSACSGCGFVLNEKEVCRSCHGLKQLFETVPFILRIPANAKNGTEIVFENMGDQKLGCETGNVIFAIKEMQHSVFEHRGNDLITCLTITVFEALCGFHRCIKLLNGTSLFIGSEKGEIIEPNTFKVIEGYGMPISGYENMYGNLIIQFHVQFPKTLSTENKATLLATFRDEIHYCDAKSMIEVANLPSLHTI